MIGYTDEQNYKDIANSIRDILNKTGITFTPEEMSDFIKSISVKDLEKYDMPIVVLKDVWSKNAVDKNNNTLDPKHIYSEYLTGTDDSFIKGANPQEYNLKNDNYLYTYTASKANYTSTPETYFEWDVEHATLENPDVFRETTSSTATKTLDIAGIRKFKMDANVTVFAKTLDNKVYNETLSLSDEEKQSLILPNENYLRYSDETEYDQENSLFIAKVDNLTDFLILNYDEYTLLNNSHTLKEVKEYLRKSKLDIYCFDKETHLGYQLLQKYDENEKFYITTIIDKKEYKIFNFAADLFYYNKKKKYKIAKNENDICYECDNIGKYKEGYLRVQGDYSVINKKHGWKIKFKNKLKLDENWPKSKSYNLKGYYDNGINTHFVSDAIYTIWRQLTDNRNHNQNPIEMQYWNGSEMESKSFTDYIEMLECYDTTLAYLKENGTEKEISNYKKSKPHILKYVESEGKGAPLQKPCLLFWEKKPINENDPVEYVCHGLYSLQINLCDKTVGYDEDEDLNYCMMTNISTLVNQTGKDNKAQMRYQYESAGTFTNHYREKNPIDDLSIRVFNGASFDDGGDYNKDIKIEAFNKLIDAVNDESTGQEWLNKLSKVLDINSLIDHALMMIWSGDPDKMAKNQFWWIDDASKIGNGAVWHFGCDSYRFIGDLGRSFNNGQGNGLKTERTAIGEIIGNKSTTNLTPDNFFRYTWTANNFLIYKIFSTTDAVVKRYNEVKDIFDLPNTEAIFEDCIDKYFYNKVISNEVNKDIIPETREGYDFFTTYVIPPHLSYFNNYTTKKTSDPYYVKLWNEHLSKYALNRMYVNYTSSQINEAYFTYITGISNITNTTYQKVPTFSGMKLTLTETFNLLGVKNILEFNKNRLESMCSEQEKENGESRPAVFSKIMRMKFIGNKEFKNFNYETGYIDVFGLLNYKKPSWVTRSNLAGGEKQVNGEFTPDQNNFKKYSNYLVNASTGEVLGFENIKIKNLKLYKLQDGEYVTADTTILNTVNGYIQFKEPTSGSYKIVCSLVNNENSQAKVATTISFEDMSNKNGNIESNEVTIYVSDTGTIIK